MNKSLNNFLDIFEDEIKFSNNYKKCLNHFIKTLKENQMKYYKELDYKLYIDNPEKIVIKDGLKYDKIVVCESKRHSDNCFILYEVLKTITKSLNLLQFSSP